MSETKLCECGCGKPTAIAKLTDRRTGAKRGQPNRFLRGHVMKMPESTVRAGAARENEKRAEGVVDRRRVVVEAYENGVPTFHIADELGLPLEIVARDIFVMREAGADLPYRCIPIGEYVDKKTAEEIEAAWSKDEASTATIAKTYGWTRVQAQAVLVFLRRAGYKINRRYSLPLELPRDETRSVAQEYKRRNRGRRGKLSEKQRVILRVLQAAKRPLAVREAAAFLDVVGHPTKNQNLQTWLAYMERRELVAHVEVPRSHRLGKNRWFVPLEAEQPPEFLTLADAERETELAALIDSQGDDLKRGDFGSTPRKATGPTAQSTPPSPQTASRSSTPSVARTKRWPNSSGRAA